MTTSNKTKQFAVRDGNGNRWFARVGDRVQWNGADYTLTAFSTSGGTNGAGNVWLHVRETGGVRATFYVRATDHFKLVRRAATKVTVKPGVAETPKAIKFIPALARGGGSVWLSVGEKYRVYLRNNSMSARFGVVDFDNAKLEAIDEKEGYYDLRMRNKNGQVTIATIANPSLTKIGGQWERYFEKV